MFLEKAKWSSNNRVEGLFPRNKRHVYYPLNLLVEKAMASHSSTLAWKIPWTEAAVHGVEKSQTRLSDFTFTFHFHALEKEMATHSSVFA